MQLKSPMLTRTIIIVLSALAIYFSGVSTQGIGIDQVGYIASAYKADGYTGAELQSKTILDIKTAVSERIFNDFQDGSEFSKALITDPRSLQQTVPLFSMRIVYIESMRFLHSFGISYTSASHQISALFGGLSVLVLALIIIRIDLSIALLPIVLTTTDLLGVTNWPSPDTLACFFSLLSIYLLIINSRIIFLIAMFLPLVRTDLIILSVLLTGYLLFLDQGSDNKLSAGIAIIFSIVAFVCVNKVYGNYGLINLFNNHHIQHTVYPAEVEISSNPKDYIFPYIWVIRDTLNSNHAVIYLIAASILVYAKRINVVVMHLYPLFIIPISYVVLHILAFPVYYERYFIASLMLALLGVLHFIKSKLINSGSFDNCEVKDNRMTQH